MNGKGDRDRSDPKKFAEGWDYIFNRFSQHHAEAACDILQFVRAKGGHLVHAKYKGTWGSVCGHKPEAPNTRIMKDRTGWQHCPELDIEDVTCDRCRKKLGMV
jgi:hypothetical protein